MIPWATVPDRIVYILKHLLSKRTLAVASVICRSLHALLVPPFHISPDRDARTSKRLGHSFRRDSLKRYDYRSERLTRIWLFGMRRKLCNLVDSESVRIRNSHFWHWHGQSLSSAVSYYTSSLGLWELGLFTVGLLS